MRKLDGYKILPKGITPGMEKSEHYEDIFLDGICLLTGTVDMSNFFSCMEEKHSCKVGKEWFTSYSLYTEEIKELYQFLIIEDGQVLEVTIDSIFRLKSLYLSKDKNLTNEELAKKIGEELNNENVTIPLIKALLKIIEG